jgi:cytochrome c-type biogenesis protein CcmE
MALTPPTDVDEDLPPEEDLPPLDLTPRAGRRQQKRALPVVLVLVVLGGALIFLAAKSLGSASMFFYNADEAVAHKTELGTKRFRLQGVVEDGSVHQQEDSVTFTVTWNGTAVHVVHRGDPPEMFQPDIPVVLEGQWQGDHFASDRILVKHTASYAAQHADRLHAADDQARSSVTTTP